MAQHFLLSAAARSLSAGQGHADVRSRRRERVPAPALAARPMASRSVRAAAAQICYDCPPLGRPVRAGAARRAARDFSVTSGTLFAWHKLPLRTYLMAIAVFCNEVKGKSMLAFARDLDVQYKTAFVLAHKLREAMASSMKALRIGGEGRMAEIDGAYFGGHVRPENLAADRIDRRLAENQSGKRQVVVAMRERGGRTLAQVFSAEADAVAAIRLRIAKGTMVHADESPAWNPLHASFAMQRINHQDGYSIDGACTNGAESYFSRLRRGELGHHHHIAGPYLASLRPGGSLARGPAPRQQRRAGVRRRRAGDAMQAIGRFLRLLATRSGLGIGVTPLDPTKRSENTAPYGLLQGGVGNIQPLAPHQEDRDFVWGEYSTVRLTQGVVVSSGKLARCEILRALARFEWRNERDQRL